MLEVTLRGFEGKEAIYARDRREGNNMINQARAKLGQLTRLWHILFFTLWSLELNLPCAPHLMAIPRLRSKNGAVLTLSVGKVAFSHFAHFVEIATPRSNPA